MWQPSKIRLGFKSYILPNILADFKSFEIEHSTIKPFRVLILQHCNLVRFTLLVPFILVQYLRFMLGANPKRLVPQGAPLGLAPTRV